MPTFTVEQAIAARAFLGWSQCDLGEAAGLSFETVRDFEHDEQSTTTKSVEAIRAAFHDAGVDFLKNGKRVGTAIVVQCQPGRDQ
jgi:transcriptional regulator with XRE-family HTH domain